MAQSKPTKEAHDHLPVRRTAAAVKSRIEEPDYEAVHTDQEVIELGKVKYLVRNYRIHESIVYAI